MYLSAVALPTLLRSNSKNLISKKQMLLCISHFVFRLSLSEQSLHRCSTDQPVCSYFSRFLVSIIRTHGQNDLKFGMLVYPDHIHELGDISINLVVFIVVGYFWLNETSQIWWLAFCWALIQQMASCLACSCILTTIWCDKNLVLFCWFFLIFMLFYASHMGKIQKLWPLSCFSLMIPGHWQNWVNFGYAVLIFPIWAQCVLSEIGHMMCLKLLPWEWNSHCCSMITLRPQMQFMFWNQKE